MAVQAHQYGANVMLIPAEGHGNRARGPQYDVVDHRGFVPAGASQHNAHNNNVFLGKNAFQIPPPVNMNGANQYQHFNQLASGRQGYAGQYQQIDGTAFMIGAEKQQIHAANAMVGSRKRTREQIEEFSSPWANAVAAPQQFVINAVTQLDTHPGSVVNPQSTNGVSTGLRLTFEEDRLRSASPVSTTGPIEAVPKPIWVENFASHLQQERDEVADLLKIQSEQLRTFIDAKRQRHTHQLIAAAEEGFARKLREKETEMDKVRRQNQELMDRFTQLNAESQHWQTKVRNTEAMVNVLRTNLAQAAAAQAAQAERQQQHTTAAQYHHQLQHPGMKEGCGDSDAVDDCASSYIDDINEAHVRARNENKELREQRTCRVCRCNDVSMLLLPCRHLCLCHDCEGQLLACPLCRTTKNASVQVYMS